MQILIAVFVFFALIGAVYAGYRVGKWEGQFRALKTPPEPNKIPAEPSPRSVTSTAAVNELSRPPSRTMQTAYIPGELGPVPVLVPSLRQRVNVNGVFYDRKNGNHYERTEGQGFDHAAHEAERARRRGN